MLIVRHGDELNDLAPDEIRLAEWFSTAIALALEIGRLYHKAQQRLSESKALHQGNTVDDITKYLFANS